MAEILYAPNREQVVTSNAWAFLHWLRTTRGMDLPDWAALQRWSASDQAAFARGDGGVRPAAARPLRLARHDGEQEALVLRRGEGHDCAFSRDRSANRQLGSLPPAGDREDGWTRTPCLRSSPPLDAALAAPRSSARLPNCCCTPTSGPMTACWSSAQPGPGSPHCWKAPPSSSRPPLPATLLAVAAEERATVLVAPAQTLAEAAFQRARRRPDLASLRTIIATGGPLSPEGRTPHLHLDEV